MKNEDESNNRGGTVVIICAVIFIASMFVWSTYCFTHGFTLSIPDAISKSIWDTENWQEHNRQCIETCVHNGGIYETCMPRCTG